MSILSLLKTQQSAFSKAEARIAKCIMANPEQIVSMTTAELARLAEVSDPMISRFCRSLGFKSYPDFKLQLAASLANNVSYISETVCLDDDTASYIEKRINANQRALEYVRETLTVEVVEQAVCLLASAEKIDIFGMGGSNAIALDAQHKLFRFGIPTTAYTDNLMQRMVSASANEHTVIILFSFTGRTASMIEVAEIAKSKQAQIIAVTTPGSPLAQLADICIAAGDELEDTTLYMPMTTRIVVLTIIDILATGLGLQKGEAIQQQLQTIKQSLDDTKI